jgi:flagellar L-ring protein FlgH
MKCCAMPINSFKARIALCAAVLSGVVDARQPKKLAPPNFEPSIAVPISSTPTPGAIFDDAIYAPLTSGARATRVGDVVTIILAEQTSAVKSNSASFGRAGDIGLKPPVTGPLSLIKPDDVNVSAKQSFKGKGDAAQSNSLNGELSVTIAATYPNGTILVRGEKLLTLNRGEERVQFSGIVRLVDIAQDNRVLSSRVADAHILYTGKGEIARASKQGWLQRFFSKVSPF